MLMTGTAAAWLSKNHSIIRRSRGPPLFINIRKETRMDTPITRAEHEEFRRRLEEENRRQDKRIGLLEENTKQIGALTISVEKLALSIESMVKEQESQGERLQVLEGRDGEKWRAAASYVLTVILGIVIGYIFKLIGM
nr:MAG TPA: hypothetical protein [Caudoviricetes sp.]